MDLRFSSPEGVEGYIAGNIKAEYHECGNLSIQLMELWKLIL
jgi:hypothetical protein